MTQSCVMTELEVPSNSPVRTESDASLSKTDTASDNEELYQSGRQKNVIPDVIHIPSASDSSPKQMQTSVRRYSSSEESDNGENEDGNNMSAGYVRGLAPPEVLLKNYRRQAREFADIGDERAVYDRVRCVALTRIIYGDNHWKLAKAYSKLSQAYLEQRGLAQQALVHAGNARDVLLAADAAKQQGRQVYDKADVLPVMELIYLIMGQAHIALKNTQKAEHSLKKAELVSREREELGFKQQDPERRLQILMCLGRVSLKAHKTGYALESFEKALEVAQKHYGEDSQQLIPIYQYLARAESSQGDASSHDRATKLFLQAHDISKSRFGEDSVEVADSSFVVASSYINDDDSQDKAKKYLEDSITLYMRHRGPYHTSTIKAQDELSRLLIRDVSLEDAVSLQRSVAEAKVVLYGDPSEQAAASYQMLGSIRLKTRTYRTGFEMAH
ncbi:TeTratriCopeptide repeat [Desmophyllum pertusum]|uniref:TeTratriCopeptide repeat n=1 Tax=Desmophyllum pertusum TaxID=174260 RepID=A0A9W9Z8Y6_9CNID|nr:TeTratriCopeptide repeat [Desmophyllum pertusum]